MKHYFFIVLFFAVVCSTAIFILPHNAQADTTRYVRVGYTGDGTSWATASGTLQAMIDSTGTPCQIWVASGTYYPTSMHAGTIVRSLSFQMKNGVSIYGGFQNTGSPTWEERNWETFDTVLSGEIGNPGTITDNCYHVFYHPLGLFLNSTAVLDGFTISGGYAKYDGVDWSHCGGGMFNDHSSPTITNCTFSENNSTYGGGMWNLYSDSNITDCAFTNNEANEGGGIHSHDFGGTISNCIFTDNTAVDGGGLYHIEGDESTIIRCTFSGNNATDEGGGMFIEQSYDGTITDCIFSGNTASYGGGICDFFGSLLAISGCTFSGNNATNQGGAIFAYHDSIHDITNCTFFGNSATDQGGAICNDEASITNCTFFGNSSAEGGAYYGYRIELILSNSILWGNMPDEISYELLTSRFSVTYSDVQGGTGQFWFETGCIDADPLWVNPGSGDFHLQSTSPCIDTGDNTASNLPAKDFEGDDRIIDGNASGTPTVDMGVDEYGVKVGIYVTLQGDNRPISGWEVPLTVGFFEQGADVLSATPVYSFTGTTTIVVTSVTKAYFECPQSVAPGTYDITSDTFTTLLNVKRFVGIW